MTHKHDQDSCCSEYSELSRRKFLQGSGLAAAAGYTAPAWMPRVAFGRGATDRDVIVNIFLRGAIDGLSFIVPHQDGGLYTARPTLAVPPPGQTNGAIDLDGFFGLNPAAQRLTTPYGNGHLAVVHAAGSTDPTRSHFDGQRGMEGGVPNGNVVGVSNGWLGRHLIGTAPTGPGDLRGLALQNLMPFSLQGGPGTVPVDNPANFGFPGRPATEAIRRQLVQHMHATAKEPLAAAATSTFESIDILAGIDFNGYTSAGATPYPNSAFGQRLRASAALIKADVDVEALAIDYDGWDHHNAQGPINGLMAGMLNDLSTAIEAFYLDMVPGGHIDSLVVLVMSEFGRRVEENVSSGTDHGHGNMMLALGGHIAGGQVFSNWPGLAPGQLDDGDLAITTDYRDVVAEILINRMDNTTIGDVFPNHTPMPIGITV